MLIQPSGAVIPKFACWTLSKNLLHFWMLQHTLKNDINMNFFDKILIWTAYHNILSTVTIVDIPPIWWDQKGTSNLHILQSKEKGSILLGYLTTIVFTFHLKLTISLFLEKTHLKCGFSDGNECSTINLDWHSEYQGQQIWTSMKSSIILSRLPFK